MGMIAAAAIVLRRFEARLQGHVRVGLIPAHP